MLPTEKVEFDRYMSGLGVPSELLGLRHIGIPFLHKGKPRFWLNRFDTVYITCISPQGVQINESVRMFAKYRSYLCSH